MEGKGINGLGKPHHVLPLRPSGLHKNPQTKSLGFGALNLMRMNHRPEQFLKRTPETVDLDQLA